MKNMSSPSVIVITGASSGLGAALAYAYATAGITLGLTGRNHARLESVATQCITQGAQVEFAALDICDADALARWLSEFDTRYPIDLLIANAGISAGTGGQGESAEQTRQIFSTNVGGVLNTVLPIVPRMQSRGHGQIAIMASLASIRSLSSCPAYSASKAAIRYWGEALRGTLHSSGVHVSVICPGYIRTPMTEVNSFPMPLIMSAEKAAGIIQHGLAKRQDRIAFPAILYWPLVWIASLPQWLTNPIFDRLPSKSNLETL